MDDYESQNNRLASQFVRDVRRPVPELSYDDYEAGNAHEAKSIYDMVARSGRGSDTAVAHVTPGDIVVPRDVWVENPTILNMVKKGFDKYGDDYATHMVGSGVENINPETGLPEFGFFKKFFKPSISAFLNPIKTLSNPMGAVGSILGPIMSQETPQETPTPSVVPQENLDISRPDDMALPGSLGSLSGLSDVQRTSNIATQGTEGQGASPEANAYFMNQIRRRLTDENSSASEINPAEENYLKRSGVSYQAGDVKSILEGIARKNNAAAKTLT